MLDKRFGIFCLLAEEYSSSISVGIEIVLLKPKLCSGSSVWLQYCIIFSATAISDTGATNRENTLLLHVTLYEYKGSRSFRFIVPKLEFGNQRNSAIISRLSLFKKPEPQRLSACFGTTSAPSYQ